jgi:hypothetical protein
LIVPIEVEAYPVETLWLTMTCNHDAIWFVTVDESGVVAVVVIAGCPLPGRAARTPLAVGGDAF